MKKMNILQKIGICLIVLGVIALVAAFPNVGLAMVSLGPAKVEGISDVSATKLFIGIVSIILGLALYFGKQGLKLLTKFARD